MKQIESSGTFSAFGKMNPIFPGLVIQNIGEVSLPLSEHQAKEIEEVFSLCIGAKHGKT